MDRHPESLPRAIFLIGARGSGKTTVASLLAARLGWPWLDADQVLETRAGRSIRAIFAEDGELRFRELETEILAELCHPPQRVVATGGGVILNPLNRQRLRQAGKVIWLAAEPETLAQRVLRDATTAERRPDLSVGGLAEIREVLRTREPLYRECAHAIVDTTGRTAEQVTDEILAFLSS